MPALTNEQRQAVAKWATEGANLNDIQDWMKRDFAITLTYLEARLLVMELGLKLQEKKREEAVAAKEMPTADKKPAGEIIGDDAEILPPEGRPAGGEKLNLTVDQVAVPGTVVSGRVTFSDGKSVAWHVDQFGRLGMKAPEPGYQPPPADVPLFQRELDLALQKAGF